MNDIQKKWISEKLVEDFRAGRIPPEEVCNELNKFEFTDFIRSQLRVQDVRWLIEKIINSEGNVLELCVNITWPLLPNQEIEHALRSLWERGHRTINIIYGILNIENLDISFHRQVFEYVRQNWNSFISAELQYDADLALHVAQKRLTGRNTPLTKSWIYWCNVAGSNNREAKKKFFESLETNHPQLSLEMNLFRREVKDFLITKI